MLPSRLWIVVQSCLTGPPRALLPLGAVTQDPGVQLLSLRGRVERLQDHQARGRVDVDALGEDLVQDQDATANSGSSLVKPSQRRPCHICVVVAVEATDLYA